MLRNNLIGLLSAGHHAIAAIEQLPLASPDNQQNLDHYYTTNDRTHNKIFRLHDDLKHGECTVSLAEAIPVVREGFTRRGIYFWAYGTAIEDYCIFWEGS
jgi:hypothetical protein